jgi:hypothetical protein
VVSFVQRRVLNSFLRVTGGKPEGIVLSLVKPKVHTTLLPAGLLAGSGGVACVEEYAPDSLPTRAKPESMVHGTPANRATCWKRWCCLCGETCAGDLGLDEKRLEGIVLSRVSSSVANVGLARVEESARQLIARW